MDQAGTGEPRRPSTTPRGRREMESFANDAHEKQGVAVQVCVKTVMLKKKGIRLSVVCLIVFSPPPSLNAEKDNSLRSSGRGCTGVAPATRSTTSECATASSSGSTTAKASHTPPSTLTRSELARKSLQRVDRQVDNTPGVASLPVRPGIVLLTAALVHCCCVSSQFDKCKKNDIRLSYVCPVKM